VDNLSFTYPDGAEALRNVSLHVRRGSTLAVIGPNGAGKTTLLKIVLGLLDGYGGKVEIAGMTPRQARRKGGVVSWVPQRSKTAWDFPVTVKQVVLMGLVGKAGLLGRRTADDLAYVENIMNMLEIAPLADKAIGEVSGGQQQRAIIARALAPRPLLLLLDEPTVGVDQAGQQTFAALMKQIKEALGVTLITVTHDLRAVLPESQSVACLNRTLHFHDSPSRLTPELLGEVFRCDLTGLFAAKSLGGEGPPCTHDHDEGDRP